jgi:hypothetical protein
MTFGIVQSVLAAAGVTVSTIQIVADGIAIAEAAVAAAACLGLCANQYVAIGLYGASIGVSGVSLALNIAAMSTLIAGTVKAGQVMDRLGGDASSLMDEFCEGTEVDAGVQAEYEKAKQKMEAEKNTKKAEMDAAKILVDADDANIQSCIDGLGAVQNPVNLEDGGTCPGTTYSATCGFTAYQKSYQNFQNTKETLYENLYAAGQALEEADNRMQVLKEEIDNYSDVQDEIDDDVEAYRQNLIAAGVTEPALSAAVEKKRTEIKSSYDQKYLAAVAEWNALDSSRQAKVDSVNQAKAALGQAIAQVPDPDSVASSFTCANPSGTLDCVSKFKGLCGNAYGVISMAYGDPCPNADNGAYCRWIDYEGRRKLHDEVEAQYDQFTATGPPSSQPCSLTSDGTVLVWSVDEAKEVLRRVDKRSILQ